MVGTGSSIPHLSVSLLHEPTPRSLHPQIAKETLYWDRPFKTVRSGSFETGDVVWFPEGGLNASYNCVDRWAYTQPDKVRNESSFVFPPPSSPSIVDQRVCDGGQCRLSQRPESFATISSKISSFSPRHPLS